MLRFNLFWAFILPIILLTSCVSKRKYLDEVSSRQAGERQIAQLQQESETLRQQLAQRIEQNQALTTERDNLVVQRDQLQRDLSRFTDRALTQQQQMDEALRNQSQELARRDQIINELREAIAQRDKTLTELLNRVKNALRQYTAEDLSVEMRDGRVYVNLSDKLLFPSGSDVVDKRGREALGALASVLKQQPDLEVVVEGHTDNVPISTAVYRNNWDLSVRRASSVVSLLTKDYGVSPAQVTAAGKGEYEPKAPNTTKESRSLNRRIEISIQPELDEIYRLLQQQQTVEEGG